MDPFQIAFAFSLGLASAVTPCVLPIVPGYLAFVFGSERSDLVKGSLVVYSGVMAGGTLTAAIIGLAGEALGGRWFLGASAVIISLIIIDSFFTHRLRTVPVGFLRGRKGSIAGFLFGMLIMLIAAPCILPLLAALSIYALTVEELATRFAILLAYSAGLGLPFVLMGAFINAGKRLMRISRWSKSLQIIVLFATLAWIIVSLLAT
ncbi:MAG: cytochrome c biogenesis protein CcdA [Candidatus Methanosuratincola petrocarbonis]